ncbi:hypothetical protein CYY_000809 [Polysphondylium violaceum]|uniref:ATP synthase subunit epsilon, mitochondrial n=1 Tax=Polysphondylium violaceum TaxID=133409 RepID=A0A8J4Q426_9MYCE|nr:hypothetical protein CYY_000809 [Polysphondylium violaceum]
MAGQFWRAAGLTYLQYSSMCASHLRNALKEPFRATANNREKFESSVTEYVNGKESSTLTLDTALLQKQLKLTK